MIKEAAIKKDGKIHTGRRHDIILNNANPVGSLRDGEQGFVDFHGTFFTREEAAIIAIDCGQITELKYHKTNLFSEELY